MTNLNDRYGVLKIKKCLQRCVWKFLEVYPNCNFILRRWSVLFNLTLLSYKI